MTSETASSSPASPESALDDLSEAASPPHQSPSSPTVGYSTLTIAIDCLIRKKQRKQLKRNFKVSRFPSLSSADKTLMRVATGSNGIARRSALDVHGRRPVLDPRP